LDHVRQLVGNELLSSFRTRAVRAGSEDYVLPGRKSFGIQGSSGFISSVTHVYPHITEVSTKPRLEE
jgi:hypothetical protein